MTNKNILIAGIAGLITYVLSILILMYGFDVDKSHSATFSMLSMWLVYEGATRLLRRINKV